jgi:hypothetical protein
MGNVLVPHLLIVLVKLRSTLESLKYIIGQSKSLARSETPIVRNESSRPERMNLYLILAPFILQQPQPVECPIDKG